MFRLVITLLLFSFLGNQLSAQALCGNAPDEPPGCLLDTIYYNGSTIGYTKSSVIPNVNGRFCTPIENDAWFQFIPVCEEVTIRFRAIGCVPRIATYGIGVAVMDEDLVVQPFCFMFPAIGFGPRRFTVPDLIPGKRYTLMLYTGASGQRCSYSLEIKGISTFGLKSPILHGDFSLGTGSTTKFYVDKEENGTVYNWTAAAGLDIISGNGTHEIMVDAPTPGTYELCCEITSTDGTVSKSCKDVVVTNGDEIIDYQKVLFCQGECHNFNGECLNEPGHYYQMNGNTKTVLELCQNPEPQVGIYGAPQIIYPQDLAPALLNGFMERGQGDYDFQWLNSAGNQIRNSDALQISVNNSGNYCFIATDKITGCSDTACVELILTAPLPEPCGPPGVAPFAGDNPPGCALCGPVYTGTTAGYSRGTRPPGFCGTIENNQWLAFQASSTTATVSITSWNCQFGRGVQLYMVDPQLNPVSSCFSSGGTNTPGNITATNLIPGQVYYIMIDGFAGDICEFSISLIGGINTGPPDPPQPIVSDLDGPCPGQVVCYEIPSVQNASNYDWYVIGDGQIIVGQGSEQVCIQWGNSGIGEVCVSPYNPCFYGDTTCLQVDVVASSAVNNLPPQDFCENEFPLDPSVYCAPGADCPGIIPSAGKFCVSVGPSSGSCDSTICYTFNAIPITRTIIDTFFCEGECLNWDGRLICESDTLELPIPTGTDCDDIVELRVREILLEAIITNPRPYDCITGDTMWLEGINSTTGPNITYEWIPLDGGLVEEGGDSPIAVIRGAGRYVLEVKYGQGGDACIARDTAMVAGELTPPIISCTSDGSSITFTWTAVPGAVDYTIDVDNVSLGNTTQTSYTVSGLVPLQRVTIGVRANGIPGCGSAVAIIECQAQDCPSVTVTIDSLLPICLGINDQPVQLFFQTIGAIGGGTTEWIALGIDSMGIFDPKIVGAGTHNLNVIYGESGCNYIGTRQVVVYERPTADFEVESPICVTNESEISYTGNASSDADFLWDFDGGNIIAGAGAGPFFIKWNTGGTYNVTLQVTENGCASDLESQQVVVVDPLPKPDLICAGATTSSVEISWANVPGATDYDVKLISGRSGIRTGNIYRVTDMNPGEEITLAIAASGNNICGPSLDTITCFAQNCPPVQVSIDPVLPICLYDNVVDFDLNDYLNLSGNTPSATITWSSIDGSISPQGIFSPSNSGVGFFGARIDIDDQGCLFFAETTIEIREVPTADFTAPAEICITETATVQPIGARVPNSSFSWNFNSGVSNNGNIGFRIFEITYPSAGTETIQHWVEVDGCISDTLEKTIQITEPLPIFNIDCSTTTNSIDFSWNPTAGATDYQTQILAAPATATSNQLDDFNINFSNLNPTDEVTIQVTISDNTSSCPPTVVEKTCEAMDCPPIEIALQNVDQICLKTGDVGTPIDLNDFMTLTGDRGTATVEWSGSTFVSMQGIFQPNSTDFGTHQIQVEVTEEGCVFTAILSIDVLKIPSSEFTAESPICLTDFSTIELINPSEPGTDFFWNFGSSSNQTGNSPTGPFELSWSSAMSDQISLVTEKDGCISDTTFAAVEIHPEIIAPTIQCDSDLETILFSWNDVPNVTDYQVTINNAPAGISTSQPDNLSFLIENLSPLEEVTITVEASNSQSACPPVSSSFNCIAAPCPPLPAPVISCTSDLTEILFEWDSISGLNNYEVTIVNAPAGFSSTRIDDFSILISDLLPDDEVEITVTASEIGSPCPPVSSSFNCTAAPCPPLPAPVIRCTSDLTEILFEWDSIPGLNNYEVTIVNAPAGFSSTRIDDFSILISDLLPNDEVEITVTASEIGSPCPSVSTTFACETLPCPTMNISFPNLPELCLNPGIAPIDFSTFVVVDGDLQNGTATWAGAGISPDGIFDPNIAGIGTHLIVFKYRELNCEYQENAEVIIHPVPVADPGEDQFISCLDSIVNLGGIANASNPTVVFYNWSGGQVENSTASNTQTTQVGTFILTATNPETGCINSDSVIVTQGPEAPYLDASILDISCFGYNDGIIKVDTVFPGTPPYLFSLNDNPFLPHSEFQQLGPGDYTVRVKDAFGCTDQISFSISEPDELTVELVIVADEIPVPFGDSIQLNAITNYAPEFLSSVQWSPVDDFPICDETNIGNCLSVFVTPTGQTVYTVRVEHLNGCADEDFGQILISKDKGIYIPSGFSPNNNDGINDVFRIYANLPQIKNIRSFLVFDRWGELLHESYNFLPEDDSHGWDGLHQGKKMQSNVFVYMAEVEFFDGSVEVFKGDVTLTE